MRVSAKVINVCFITFILLTDFVGVPAVKIAEPPTITLVIPFAVLRVEIVLNDCSEARSGFPSSIAATP